MATIKKARRTGVVRRIKTNRRHHDRRSSCAHEAPEVGCHACLATLISKVAELEATTRADSFDYGSLDEGVRETVRWLRGLGFKTTDSGDGRSKFKVNPNVEALDHPHVFMVVEPDLAIHEAKRLRFELSKVAVEADPCDVQLMFDPLDGVAVLTLSFVDDERLGLARKSKQQTKTT